MSRETQGQGQQQQQQEQQLSLEEIQNRTLCNWCRNPMVMSEQITEENFIDVGIKWHEDDAQNAQALYCSSCLADDFRKSQPKSVIDRTTLMEANVQDLQQQEQQQQAPSLAPEEQEQQNEQSPPPPPLT